MKPILVILVIAILIMTTQLSCRFSRPLIEFPQSTNVTIDSVTHDTIRTKYSKFLCFRKGISIGGCTFEETFTPQGQLVKKGVYKETNYGMFDGTNRFYLKTITYDTIDHTREIHKTIRQNHGVSGSVVLDKKVTR